jgi:hypothetical protein
MRIGFRRTLLPALGLALLYVVPLAAQKQRASLYNKFELNLSGSGVILNSNIRVDGSGGEVGTDIDAEDDLGMDKVKAEPRFGLRWRPGRRHELEVGYQFARRNAEKRLERDITFGDSTYTVGADLKSTFNSDQVFFAYRFAFMAKERTQIGAALGLGALLLDVGLEALGTGTDPRQFSVEKSVTGPLGSLGLYGRFLAGERWRFEADARAVKIAISRFDARVIEIGGAVRYYLSNSFALDAGYSGSGIKVDVGPKTSEDGEETGLASGVIKYSLQSIRLGIVIVP